MPINKLGAAWERLVEASNADSGAWVQIREALLVDEELAEQVRNDWDAGEYS